MGIARKTSDDYLRVGTLMDFLPDPKRPVLNALHHPLPHQNVPTPPALHSFASAEQAMTHLQGHPFLPAVDSPWGDMRWGLVATNLARSPTHMDVLATAMTVLTGVKLVGIGVPLADKFEENGYEGDLGSRHAVDNWADVQTSGRLAVYRWEVFLLLPNMSL